MRPFSEVKFMKRVSSRAVATVTRNGGIRILIITYTSTFSRVYQLQTEFILVIIFTGLLHMITTRNNNHFTNWLSLHAH
jgi:hypothetical protein